MSDLRSPKPTAGDHVHSLVKGGLGAIPVLGSPAAELFSLLIAPPLEKRRAAWMDTVGETLNELQSRGIDLQVLQNDDSFIDTVLQASQTALRQSSEEKRRALRNAILNTGLPHAPDDSRREMFLRWIDELTPVHLRVLRLFHDPPRWFASLGVSYQGGGALSQTLEDGIPELRGERALYDQIWNDLNQRGLVNTHGLHAMMTSSGTLASRTSELGSAFIQYIEDTRG